MTQELYEILKVKGYPLTLRGNIHVKGKGDMTTYFLDGPMSSAVPCGPGANGDAVLPTPAATPTGVAAAPLLASKATPNGNGVDHT